MSNSQQFLTDEEYEGVRRDISIIMQDIRFNTRLENGVLNIDVQTGDAIAKLTAYVDQKIKRYY